MVQPTFLARNVETLEHAIAAKLAVLGIDPSNVKQMRELAREALDTDPHKLSQHFYSSSLEPRVRAELLGLIALMFQTMASAASMGEELHGGPVWKAVARAIYEEAESRGLLPEKGM